MVAIDRRTAVVAMFLTGGGICSALEIIFRTSGHSSLLCPLIATACLFAASALVLTHRAASFRRDLRLLRDIEERCAVIRPAARRPSDGLEQAVRSLMDVAEEALFDAAGQARELRDQLQAVSTTHQPDSNPNRQRSVKGSTKVAVATDPLACDPSIEAMIQELQKIERRGSRRIMERKVTTAAGERTFRVILSPVVPEGGMVAVCQDTTNERAISEMKNDFVSMVSHELRTPLASIKAYVEMLIDGEAEDEKTQFEFYDVIQNEANRLGRLIDNILNISRIESGLARTSMELQTLDPILDDAIDVITPQAVEKQITITSRRSSVHYQTSIDRDMLYQAVLNLLTNAIKYTASGGSITIETALDAARNVVLARIIDTGVGIPPKDLPYVFDKFYRAEANNRIAPGTGLGLALVRHIVETVHNGHVFVQSQLGQGSCFGFELPTATS